jgi:hypothetical protein
MTLIDKHARLIKFEIDYSCKSFVVKALAVCVQTFVRT